MTTLCIETKSVDVAPVLQKHTNRMPVLILIHGESEFSEAWYHDDGKFYQGHKEDCDGCIEDVSEWAYMPRHGENCGFDTYGWIMWDKDDPKGFNDSFFVHGKLSPVDSEVEQKARGGDHRDHVWDAFPLYRKVVHIENRKGDNNE